MQIAQASKARLQALAQSFHLTDAQSIYKKPIDLIYLNNLVALETGVTAASSTSENAEAIISYTSDKKHHLAVSFGHQDAAVADSRRFINILTSSNFELAQNPLHIFYAVDEALTPYAVGLFYSAKNDKRADLKESSVGLSLGVEIGQFQVSALYVPVNFVEAAAGKKFEGRGHLQSSVSYLLDKTLFEFTYVTSQHRLSKEVAGAVTLNELHRQDIVTLGLVDSNRQVENDFFWGAQVITARINCGYYLSAVCDKVFTRSTLPVWFGVETQVEDWLIVRGTVKQSFLINITKDDIGYPVTAVNGATGLATDVSAGASDTVVAAGIGFKFKNLILDGVLSIASTQQIHMTNFLSQVGITYNF